MSRRSGSHKRALRKLKARNRLQLLASVAVRTATVDSWAAKPIRADQHIAVKVWYSKRENKWKGQFLDARVYRNIVGFSAEEVGMSDREVEAFRKSEVRPAARVWKVAK